MTHKENITAILECYFTGFKKEIIESACNRILEQESYEELDFVQPHKKVSVNLEPCDDICEWFEQYVDIVTDIVELRFSDGTVKRAKRGLYMRDIEKSIRKMMIDQIANEKKQEPKWIPVGERLPEWDIDCLVVDADGDFGVGYYREDAKAWDSPSWGWLERKDEVDNHEAYTEPCGIRKVIAWMPLPEPYKAERG